MDEGQDLPKDFFAYASQCVAHRLSVFADDDQAIGKRRSTLEDIKSAAGLPDPILLTENHRNTPEIARLAEWFHQGRLPMATVMRSGSGDIPQLVKSSRPEVTVERIATELTNRANSSIGVIVDQNPTGKEIHKLLRDRLPESRIDIYSSTDRNENSIDVRQPGVTVLNRKSVKGQEFDTVFILELECFIPCRSHTRVPGYVHDLHSRSRPAVSGAWPRPTVTASAEIASGFGNFGTMNDIVQHSLFEESPVSEPGRTGKPEWLGIVIDNRRLFDALQDGWLRPEAQEKGMVAGVESFGGTAGPFVDNRIPVWLRIDTAKLPDLEVSVLRNNEWRALMLSHVTQPDSLVLWPGVLPTSSIRNITVACDEHRARLKALARRASNILVPDNLKCGAEPNDQLPHIPPLSQPMPVGIVIPDIEDGIRGAMTMALWGVPRIDPWLDLLVASLSDEPKKLTRYAKELNASWWRFPPWSRLVREKNCDDAVANDAQECLWLAAINVFGAESELRPKAAADAIAQTALQEAASEEHRCAILDWQQTTHQIQRAEASIKHDDWRRMPVGLAIQLLLARPEPADFKTWLHDDAQPSPTVIWTAATLCGLLHGYRRLDIAFRGSPAQQEIVAVQALRISSRRNDFAWPAITKEAPCWRKESRLNKYILSWGGQDFAEKREKERGRLPAPPTADSCKAGTDEIPGFALVHDFITEEEEKDLVQMIDETGRWNSELARRTQHYGWRYDYGSRRVNQAAYIGKLPEWAEKLGRRLHEEGHVQHLPDQLIVNEYVKNQGIAPHIDSSAFADGVAMISLLEAWEMDFLKDPRKLTRRLDRRSVAVLSGEARYKWKHGIRKRKSEPADESSGGKRIPRERRLSLTFRKVMDAPKARRIQTGGIRHS